MRIGIITYHWAFNYGAVLQAYALQTYLEKLGHKVEFINYIPKNQKVSILRKFIGRNIESTKLKLKTLRRELIFKPFVKKLHIGEIKYQSYQELLKTPPNYDVYITGSDQVWNNKLVCSINEDNAISYPYYLDFGDESIIRVAYAPSFGSSEISSDLKINIKKCLSRFNSISVREKSGVEIVKSLGYSDAKLMPDPTFLLSKDEYLNIKTSNVQNKEAYVYSYIDRKSTRLNSSH